MKKLLSWGAIGLLTTALLDPLIYSMLEQPIPWVRDIGMAVAGIACFYAVIKFRHSL